MNSPLEEGMIGRRECGAACALAKSRGSQAPAAEMRESTGRPPHYSARQRQRQPCHAY